MHVGIPKEIRPGEARVGIVPESFGRLQKLGLEARVERGAGEARGIPDAAYAAKGASLVSRAEALACEIVVSVNVPEDTPLAKGALLVCMADPLGAPQTVERLARQGVSCIALELMPRISRAQAMDVLSSQANVAGYKAMLLAAARSTRLFPLLMTAAGKVRPAKVFVLGAGVAGLQAIATAKRLGAMVEAFDIRTECKQEVESLGARFVDLKVAQDGRAEGGYARELTAEEKARQAELMASHVQAADVVVTTAAVPGRRAPRLIPADVVRGMKAGSVIVDMAAESGGNCELSKPGEEVLVNGVAILGPRNLPSSAAQSASLLYSNNAVSFLALVVREQKLVLDLADEVVRAPLVCHGGQVTSERVKELLTSARSA
jgi:NAD(P) transhydrogenase subunit alpha